MSIHTFTVRIPNMKNGKYWATRKMLFNLMVESLDDSSDLRKCICHYMTRSYSIIAVHFHQFPGVIVELKKLRIPHLDIRVNPSVLIGGDYDDLYSFDVQTMQECEKQINALLKMLHLYDRFMDLMLVRCDCTYDIDLRDGCTVEQLLNCVRRTAVARGYERVQFPETVDNAKEKNKHSFRVACDDIELTVYDKSYQLMAENLMPEDRIPPDRMRLEVSLRRNAFRRVLLGMETEDRISGQEALELFDRYSKDLLRCYFSHILTPGAYLRFDQAVQRIEKSNYRADTKEMMILFLHMVSCKTSGGITEAKREMKQYYTKNEIRYMLKCFENLNLNPATLPNKCPVKQVPSLKDMIAD